MLSVPPAPVFVAYFEFLFAYFASFVELVEYTQVIAFFLHALKMLNPVPDGSYLTQLFFSSFTVVPKVFSRCERLLGCVLCSFSVNVKDASPALPHADRERRSSH